VALMLVAVLHFVPDEDSPGEMLRALLNALPPGSYLVASHVSNEHNQSGLDGAGRAYASGGMRGQLRTSEEFAELAFEGLEMVDPGVVLVSDWRPATTGARPMASEVNTYGGVARKP
jgi:hypothetical protein